VFEENPGITSAADLRDFAKDAEQDEENQVKPTYEEVKAFLGGQGRSQVHKEVKQEWPGRINKPLGPGLHFAIDGLDWKSQTPKTEQSGFQD
jgi:hypothetical protein